MIKIQKEQIGDTEVSIVTHDGFFYVNTYHVELGYQGEPEQFNTIEEAKQEFYGVVDLLEKML